MEALVKEKYGRITPQAVREFLAEMMGTFILCMFGIGSVAHLVLGKGESGSYLSINFGWGLGVAFGVYWSAGISGGHINPAVTLAMAVTGRLPKRKLPVYWAGQTLGAFLASAIVFGLYKDIINAVDPKQTIETAGIWAPYPNANVSKGTIFGDQLIGTFLLVGTIFALTDKKNNAPNPELLPFVIGFLVLVIGASFGMNCGYGINPARDLIPRVFTAIAGWKSLPFTAHGSFFWIPIIAQLLGGVLGGLVYIITVEMHHPNQKSVPLTGSSGIEEDKV